MTDQELNKAIAEKLGFVIADPDQIKNNNAAVYRNTYGELRTFDYCNNWSDLMNEIDKLDPDIHVNITYQGNEVELVVNGVSFNAVSAYLKRALAECLLKVLQGESGS